MAATRRHASTYAARTLLILSLATRIMAQDLNAMTYKGCYSSSAPLSKKGEYTYQTSGYCQPICVKANQAVLGLTNGNECWCGNDLPPSSSKVDDSKCSDPCDGYNKEDCGGNGYWTVYLSGTEDNVSSDTSSGGSSQTSAAPSLVTTISPGKTVVITQPASTDSNSDSDSSSGGGTNGTAIAAGVVVAIVVVSGVIAGLFFYLRHRRRQAAEEEYKRTQVSEFMRNGELKPPPTGYSSTSASDSRLDPEYGNRRNSHGSIADNEDFSRKILRVANPDRGH